MLLQPLLTFSYPCRTCFSYTKSRPVSIPALELWLCRSSYTSKPKSIHKKQPKNSPTNSPSWHQNGSKNGPKMGYPIGPGVQKWGTPSAPWGQKSEKNIDPTKRRGALIPPHHFERKSGQHGPQVRSQVGAIMDKNPSKNL